MGNNVKWRSRSKSGLDQISQTSGTSELLCEVEGANAFVLIRLWNLGCHPYAESSRRRQIGDGCLCVQLPAPTVPGLLFPFLNGISFQADEQSARMNVHHIHRVLEEARRGR